jgi:hypothetical protein
MHPTGHQICFLAAEDSATLIDDSYLLDLISTVFDIQVLSTTAQKLSSPLFNEEFKAFSSVPAMHVWKSVTLFWNHLGNSLATPGLLF